LATVHADNHKMLGIQDEGDTMF